MGLFDVFCNVIAGGAAAQHDHQVHGTTYESGAFAASETRRMAGTGHGNWAHGYAGHAAYLGTQHRPIDER